MPLLGSKTGSAFHSKCKLMFLWRPTGPHYVPCLSSLTSCYSPTPILMQPHCPPCFSFGTLVTFLFLGICCRYPMCLECSSPVKYLDNFFTLFKSLLKFHPSNDELYTSLSYSILHLVIPLPTLNPWHLGSLLTCFIIFFFGDNDT